MIRQRAHKVRIYPSTVQIGLLAMFFGAARWVWNTCLAWRTHAYRVHDERVTGVDFSRELTWLKHFAPYAWLADVPSDVLAQAIRDQDRAFANFFTGRARYPRFKRKQSAQAIRFCFDHRHAGKMKAWANGQLVLPSLGVVNVRWSKRPTGIPKMVTVRRDACGRYFVSFMVEEEVQALPQKANAVGVDVGLKDIAVTSDGEKSGNPRYLSKYLRRLKHQGRNLSRKRKSSNRWKRQRQRVARLHARISDARQDFLHKLTTGLIREHGAIAIEDLAVKGLCRTRLAKSMGDASLGELRRQLEYKAAWYGRELLVADRFAPTSKTCSVCDVIQPAMPLKVRAWTCPDCGTAHDRDINAAKNVLIFATAGRAGFNARGGVQPPEAVAAEAA